MFYFRYNIEVEQTNLTSCILLPWTIASNATAITISPKATIVRLETSSAMCRISLQPDETIADEYNDTSAKTETTAWTVMHCK